MRIANLHICILAIYSHKQNKVYVKHKNNNNNENHDQMVNNNINNNHSVSVDK